MIQRKILSSWLLWLLLLNVFIPFALNAEHNNAQIINIKDDSGQPGNSRGQIGNTYGVLKKDLVCPVDPKDILEASIVYYSLYDAYNRSTKRHHNKPENGVEWSNLIIKVNTEEAAKDKLVNLASKGWHQIKINPTLLKKGINSITFSLDGADGYFYLGVDQEKTFNRSSSSQDKGRSFQPKVLSPGRKPAQGEYMVRLKLKAKKESGFIKKGKFTYAWLETEDLFSKDKRNENGWQSIRWTGGNNRPSREFVAHAASESNFSFVFDIPHAGKWYTWVRCWTDGYYGGSFKVSWNNKLIYNSKGKVEFPADLDLEFKWIKVPAVELQKGLQQLSIDVNGKCGHMQDVIVLSDDPDYKPDTLKSLPPFPVSKKENPKEVFSKFEKGVFLDPEPMKWAKPLAGNRLSTLWLVSNNCEREIQELTRRLDMKADIISGERNYFHGVFGHNLLTNQLDGLFDVLQSHRNVYDVCIMVDVKIDQLPQELQNEFAKLIKAGMGLICVDSKRNSNSKGSLAKLLDNNGTTVQVKEFNSPVRLSALNQAVTFNFGKGKIIKVTHMLHGMSEFVPYDYYDNLNYPYQEYLYAKWIELLLFASGWYEKNPYMKKVSYDQKNNTVLIDIHSVKHAKNYKIKAVMFDPLNHKTTDISSNLSDLEKGSKLLSVKLPAGETDGLYRVYLTLLNNNNKIIDFSAVDFQKHSQAVIASITTGKEIYQPTEKIILKLNVENRNHDNQSLKLRTRIFAAHDALIAQKIEAIKLAPGRQEISEEIETIPSANIAVLAQVDLLKNDIVQSRKEKWISIQQRSGVDDFFTHAAVFQNKEVPQYLENVYFQIHEMLGIRSSRTTHRPFSSGLAEYGLRWLSNYSMTKAGYCSKAKDGIRRPCFHAPDFWDKESNKLKQAAERYSKMSPVFLGVGDEENICIHDEACFSEYTIAAFRKWLKITYGTLEKLNDEWECRFKSWNEVLPWKVEKACMRPDNIAPWLDFRVFMSLEFTRRVKKSCEIVKNILPDVPVGGINPVKYDYMSCVPASLIFPTVEYAVCYPRFLDKAHSFFSSAENASIWTGYNYTNARMTEDCWKAAAYGIGTVNFFGVCRTLGYETLTNTLALGKRAKCIKRIITNLGSGIGKFLVKSHPLDNRIAIVYDYRSQFAYTPVVACREKSKGKILPQGREYDNIVKCYANYLNSKGISYNYISPSHLIDQNLRKYKAVILPNTMLISSKELAALKIYANKGGLVLTDKRFGIMDEHGKIRDKSQLEEIRKIKKIILPVPQKLHTKLTELNNALNQADITSLETWNGDISLVVRRKLNKAKIWVIFGDGKLQMNLPKQGYFYDLRTHKFLGLTNNINLDQNKLPEGSPSVLIELPRKIEQLELNLSSEGKPGTAVHYKVGLVPSQRITSVARVEVYQPDNKLNRIYSSNLLLKGSKASGKFYLPLNAQSGTWKIIATDVASGISKMKSFKVNTLR